MTPRLPRRPPSCWIGGQSRWDEYRALAKYTARPGFTYCTDCTPEYKQEAVQLGTCQYPGTTFVKIHGVTVGRRGK